MELTSRSAIRGVAPRQVLEAVEAYLDTVAIPRARKVGATPEPADIDIAEWRDGWTVVTWPAYFAPRDLTACTAVSRQLCAVVSAVTTTVDEGWSHSLFGCGTLLDRFHSYPAGLGWDGEDAARLADEWSGDHELVARVLGVDARGLRRHFCQATPARRDHPGRERDGYLGLWAALGIRPRAEAAPYAVLEVGSSWRDVTAPSAGAARA